jgi:tetratricopeptide (TPR) repeat protein
MPGSQGAGMAGFVKLRAVLRRLFGGSSVNAIPAGGQRTVSVQGGVDKSRLATGSHNVTTVSRSHPAPQPAPPSPLRQLPADITDFARRGAQVEKLLGALRAPGGRAAISGIGGLGKTTLAVHVAHRLTGGYPDAQIVVDMAATSAAPLSPAQGLARVIWAFEPLLRLPETVAELRRIFLHVLRGKRVLLMLDDALDGEQVAPLLPPEDCALIVTSRRRIAVAGLERVDLDLLAPDEAAGLLRTITGERRVTAAELSRITALCGFLPLALRVAGMFLAASPHWSATAFIDALADERERLARLKLDGSADLDVAASLALSVRELRRTQPGIADRWHELAVFPATFDEAAAGGLWYQPAETARDALRLLLSRSMVLYDEAQQRWRLHDLIRDLAGGRVAAAAFGAPADLAARLITARVRHAQHYCGVLGAANDLYLKGGAHVLSGLVKFDRERRNIETGQAWAAGCAADDGAFAPTAARLCVNYPNAGAHVLPLRQHPRQRIPWLETAATAARKIGDRRGEGNALGNLGLDYWDLGEPRRAIEFYERVLLIVREIGDRRGAGNTLGNLGNAYAGLGEPRRAIEFYEQQLTIAREIGDRRGEGSALSSLGVAYAGLGEPRRAIEFYEQVLLIAREIGDRRGEGIELGNLGNAYADLGEPRRAIAFYEQQLTIAREVGNRRGEGIALGNLGITHKKIGEPRRAIEFYEQQLTIAQDLGDRGGEGIALNNLALAYQALGDLRRAIAHLRGALNIFEAIESPHAAQVRAAIATLEKEEGTASGRRSEP